MPEFVKQGTTIRARTGASFKPSEFMLFDPDEPHKSAEQLAAEQGSLTDPNEIQWNCPGCNKSFSWEIFNAHALPCYKRWRKVAPGWRRHVKFAGATLVTPTATLITPEEVR